ncbi:MAG: enoyl-CoA hydratase-related protein, partial [Actinomycetia bacterium]|nr:enoyl-CoA hydratase-related protein [Actinomycetes bacterium]
VGMTHAADILLSGRVVLAEELERMGFFNRVLPAEQFEGHVHDYARGVAAVSPASVATTKRQLWADLLHPNPAAAVEHSKELIGTAMQHPDYAEGVAAFLEKRTPRFTR